MEVLRLTSFTEKILYLSENKVHTFFISAEHDSDKHDFYVTEESCYFHGYHFGPVSFR